MNLFFWRADDADEPDEPHEFDVLDDEQIEAENDTEIVPVDEPSNVIEMRKAVPDVPEAPPTETVDPPAEREPGRVARALTPYVERRLLPTGTQAKAATKWWARAVAKIAVYIALHPWTIFSELRPIWAGLFYLAAGWTRWVNAAVLAEHVKAAEGDYKTKAGHHNETRKEGRRRFSVFVGIAVIVGIGYLAITGQTQWLIGIGLGVVAVLDAVGRAVRKPKPGPISMLPKSEVGAGSPLATIETVIEDTLTEHGHVPTVAEGKVVEHGVSFKVHSKMEITDIEIDAVERALQGYPGSVVRIQDRHNAAVGEMKWMWEDPLDKLVLPPRYAPRSQTVTVAADMGLGWSGQKLMLSFLRTNIFLVGGPGSGKTSVGIAMADFLTATDDARISIIDLSMGPFTEMFGDLPYRVATTEKEAEDLLRESLDRIKRRTKALAGRARPTVGGRPVPGSENWNPKIDGGPQHTIFMDEVPTFVTNPTLRELWAEHMRTGRKAAENSVGMSQSSDGDTIKMTALRKYPTTTIMLASSREDVIGLLGGGMLKAGWRPDRLVPAEGDDANDAGKGYVWGGSFQTPTPWRFPRIEMEDVWMRVMERLPAGVPLFEDQAVPLRDDTVDVVVVPEVLAAIERVFVSAGTPEKIPSNELLVALNAEGIKIANTTALARQVADWLAPRPTRWYLDDANHTRVKGYWWDDVREAIAGLSEG